MASPYVRDPLGAFDGLIGSTSVAAGDLLYHDGADWEKADADDATKPLGTADPFIGPCQELS